MSRKNAMSIVMQLHILEVGTSSINWLSLNNEIVHNDLGQHKLIGLVIFKKIVNQTEDCKNYPESYTNKCSSK